MDKIYCSSCSQNQPIPKCKRCYADRAQAKRDLNRATGLCRCGKPVGENDTYCVPCRERNRAWRKRYNKEEGRIRTANWREKNFDKLKVYSKTTIAERKQLVFAAYGGNACSCPGGCEVTQKDFLSIDHIEGGGRKHRKEIGGHIYRWLIKNNFPPGFRVLCMNCNFALGRYGRCPHQDVGLSI